MSRLIPLVIAILVSACATTPPAPPHESTYDQAIRTRICPVHHVRMTSEKVQIAYGLIGVAPGVGPNAKIEAEQFPFGPRIVIGGCEVDTAKPTIKILICPLCEKAQRQWCLAHPEDTYAQYQLARKKGQSSAATSADSLY